MFHRFNGSARGTHPPRGSSRVPRMRADAFFRASALAFAAAWPPLIVRCIVPVRSCDSNPEMDRWMSATLMPPSTLFRWLLCVLLRGSSQRAWPDALSSARRKVATGARC